MISIYTLEPVIKEGETQSYRSVGADYFFRFQNSRLHEIVTMSLMKKTTLDGLSPQDINNCATHCFLNNKGPITFALHYLGSYN